MRKSLLLTALASALVTIASCGSLADQPAERTDLVITGEPAIDAASIFYTPEEAASVNLSRNSAVSTRAAGPVDFVVTVYGPLSDRRLIRGKKLAVNVLVYGSTPEGETYSVTYGLDATRLYDQKELTMTGYGNRVAIFDLPYSPTAKKFYYRIVGSKGTVYDNGGIPFSLEIYESAVSLRLADGKLTLNYSGKSAGAGGYVHAGWNNWKDVSDRAMNYIGYSIPKYAQPGGYSTVTIDVPWWSEYLDFVFCGNGVWDNNGGSDWHYSLKPLVDANVTSYYNGKKIVNLYYSAGRLNPPIAHYGINGWLEAGDKELSYNYAGQWSTSLEINPNAATLNACFKDRNNNWENNFGKNWNFSIR